MNGYKLLLPDKGNPNDLYSSYEKHQLMQNALALWLACLHAQEWMADGYSWNECCEEVANSLKHVVAFDISGYSIQKWNRQYCTNEKFLHMNKYVATGINPGQNLFTLFPKAKAHLLTFVAANLDTCSIESVQNYLNETLIPGLCQKYNDGMFEAGRDEDDCLTVKEFLEMELVLSKDGISKSTHVSVP